MDIHARYVHMDNAMLYLEKYTDGSLALVAEAFDEDGLPDRDTFSVNLSAYDMHPPEGHVFIKAEAEHEGLTDALVKLGVVEVVKPIQYGPYGVRGHLVKITHATLATLLQLGGDGSKNAYEEGHAKLEEEAE